jgi:hypothetical protein
MTAEPHDPLDRRNELESVHGSLKHAAHVAAMQDAATVLVPTRDLMVLLAGAPIRAKENGRAFLPGEPLFVIRAKDDHSHQALQALVDAGLYSIEPEVVARFQRWRDQNPAECKEPD